MTEFATRSHRPRCSKTPERDAATDPEAFKTETEQKRAMTMLQMCQMLSKSAMRTLVGLHADHWVRFACCLRGSSMLRIYYDDAKSAHHSIGLCNLTALRAIVSQITTAWTS